MNRAALTSEAGCASPIAPDLLIDFSLAGYVRWHGTRAQIEAEGLIAPGKQWPRGFRDGWWSAHGWEYRLVRQRPPGAKGHRRHFLEVDYWMLTRWPVGGDAYLDTVVREKRRELERAIFDASERGRFRRLLEVELRTCAKADRRFQAILARMAPPAPSGAAARR